MAHQVLKLLKISPKQYGILATIHYEGPASQRALGEMLKIDRSTMVLLTDDLEKMKLEKLVTSLAWLLLANSSSNKSLNGRKIAEEQREILKQIEISTSQKV